MKSKTLLLCLSIILGLTACGQTGSLYIPSEAAEQSE